MGSSLATHCEEDVSSTHVDTEKPNVNINPSLTQSVAGDKPQLGASTREANVDRQ